jgi:hypothetical protein
MEERGNKTIVCSVFFLDIVEYSKKNVSDQISLKERFNAFISIAIRDVPINDRIILDTGDGAAISFLGDIEDALQAALSLRSSLLNEGVRMEPPLLVRMGINLGPVRLVKDINSLPNIVGDGINVAQRVMGFADPGQILVSRSYYDAVSRLSQEYAGMFHYQGSRTDKHVREHEVYAIGYPGEFTSTQQRMSLVQPRSGFFGLLDKVTLTLKQYLYRTGMVMESWSESAYQAFLAASGRRKSVYIAIAIMPLVILMILLVKFTHRPVPVKIATLASPQQAAVSSSVSAVVKSAPPVAARVVPVSAPVDVHKNKSDVIAKPGANKSEATVAKPKAVKINKDQVVKKNSRVRTLAETIGTPGIVGLTILPWGEIYLDGNKQGISPPLLELQVVPGTHVIRVTNADFPDLVRKVVVKQGEKIKIKHKFGN